MKRILYSLIILVSFSFVACDKDDNVSSTSDFTLDISGLEALGADFIYEGWLIVDGNAITTGTFNVDAQGTLSETSFTVESTDLASASTFVLTIEPSPDPDPAPSDVHILAGDFSGTSAELTIDHPAALSQDFAQSAGTYILATPTDGMDNNEKSGIWFLDPMAGPGAGLTLPDLPAGWAYEGWAVQNGTPLSTGTFTNVSGADSFSGFSGMQGSPPFPGEDFVANAPMGMTFPLDLSGGTAVISIEPVPDNSPAPFLLKPLVGGIPMDAADHTPYTISPNLNFPTGQVSR